MLQRCTDGIRHRRRTSTGPDLPLTDIFGYTGEVSKIALEKKLQVDHATGVSLPARRKIAASMTSLWEKLFISATKPIGRPR